MFPGGLFLEQLARPLLVVHAILGATLVALTTHHLVWIIRSRGARRRGEPRFALLASGFFLLAFLLGSALYPTYRVRVRAELFDAPPARAAELEARRVARRAPGPVAPAIDLPRVARLFDVKEHLVAQGLFASLGLLWLARRSAPQHPETRVLYVGLAAYACAVTWTGAVIGLYTTSIRAIGSIG